MRKLITFLGKVARTTQYQWQDQIFEGRVFAEALRQFVHYDKMLVFLTAEARETTYPMLAALQDPRIEPIDIPDGRTSAEMWQTFSRLTEVVADEDVLIFDITHGFRSIPFFVFLAVAFLKSVRQAEIEAVYYGALELDQPAPVLDLTEFVNLLDWMNASDQFVQYGNAQGLVSLLQAQASRAHEAEPEDAASLHNAAQQLDETSRALRLLIPDQAMRASHRLETSLPLAADAYAQYAHPFVTLSEKVMAAYRPLALRQPRHAQQIKVVLQRERTLIFWYLERHLLLQAIALAREWLISWGLLWAGSDSLHVGGDRAEMSQAFREVNQAGKLVEQVTFKNGSRLSYFPQIQLALSLYERIGKVRNDLCHAGQTVHQPQNPLTREQAIHNLCLELKKLPLE